MDGEGVIAIDAQAGSKPGVAERHVRLSSGRYSSGRSGSSPGTGPGLLGFLDEEAVAAPAELLGAE